MLRIRFRIPFGSGSLFGSPGSGFGTFKTGTATLLNTSHIYIDIFVSVTTSVADPDPDPDPVGSGLFGKKFTDPDPDPSSTIIFKSQNNGI